jgi:hypothetical protein
MSDDETAIRHGVVEILLALSRGRSPEELSSLRVKMDEILEELKGARVA